MNPKSTCHDGKIIEKVCRFRLSSQLVEGYLRESKDELPMVIYPEIRVITADKITLNKTFYPTEVLKGSGGTGIRSFTRPYPIPVIKDHNTYDSDCVYGRIYKTPQLVTDNGATYVRAIAAITNPDAIEATLDRRFLTVSLGSRTDEVRCSICKIDQTTEWCEHRRGQFYPIPGSDSKKEFECYYIIGKVWAKEVSYVITPSDEEAGVLNPDTQAPKKQGEQVCYSGSVTRVLVENSQGLFDLVRGRSVQESFLGPTTHPVAACGNFFFQGF